MKKADEKKNCDKKKESERGKAGVLWNDFLVAYDQSYCIFSFLKNLFKNLQFLK